MEQPKGQSLPRVDKNLRSRKTGERCSTLLCFSLIDVKSVPFRPEFSLVTLVDVVVATLVPRIFIKQTFIPPDVVHRRPMKINVPERWINDARFDRRRLETSHESSYLQFQFQRNVTIKLDVKVVKVRYKSKDIGRRNNRNLDRNSHISYVACWKSKFISGLLHHEIRARAISESREQETRK